MKDFDTQQILNLFNRLYSEMSDYYFQSIVT
jgi:hypothetical protein